MGMDTNTAQTIVKVIAVLYWIGAFFSIIGGLGLLLGGGALGFALGALGGGLLGGFLVAMGVVFLVIGVLEIFVGLGLWRLKSWARIVAIVLGVLGVISGVISLPLGILTLIISGGIVYFLAFNDEVKGLFK